MPEGQPRKSSPWVWVGVGCLAMVIVIVLVLVLGVFSCVRWTKNIAADQADPKRRDTNARAMLGVETLPEGYHATVALSVPFLMDLAVISDAPPTEGKTVKELGTNGLVFMRFIAIGDTRKGLEDHITGKSADPKALERTTVDIKVQEVLRRGTIEGEPRLLYVVQRGDLNVQQSQAGTKLVTMVLPECGSGGRIPLAIWYAPNVETVKADDPATLAGTIGDEARIAAFMRQFKLCP